MKFMSFKSYWLSVKQVFSVSFLLTTIFYYLYGVILGLVYCFLFMILYFCLFFLFGIFAVPVASFTDVYSVGQDLGWLWGILVIPFVCLFMSIIISSGSSMVSVFSFVSHRLMQLTRGKGDEAQQYTSLGFEESLTPALRMLGFSIVANAIYIACAGVIALILSLMDDFMLSLLNITIPSSIKTSEAVIFGIGLYLVNIFTIVRGYFQMLGPRYFADQDQDTMRSLFYKKSFLMSVFMFPWIFVPFLNGIFLTFWGLFMTNLARLISQDKRVQKQSISQETQPA